MKQGDEANVGSNNASCSQRKPYLPPQLTLFGQVAALTQNVSCSASDDGNQACVVGQTSNSMGMNSDRRLKEQIVRIGDHPLGFGLYLYHYKAAYRDTLGHARQFGVLADEVQALVPHAVTQDENGFLAVRYDLLGVYPALH